MNNTKIRKSNQSYLWLGVISLLFTANRHGGDVTLIHLPEIGIKGNTHFPFSDLNNLEIADLLSQFLKQKGLD